MRRETKFQPFIFLFIGLSLLVYAGYFVWNEIEIARSLYIDKQKEIIGAEKKQEQLVQLKGELERAKENRAEVVGALIIRDDALKVIERIEGVASREGLLYEVRLLGEVTKESIDRELAAIRRSRRSGKDEAIIQIVNKLPNITFNIDLTGDYLGIIRFLEGIGTLPYYTQVERFELFGKKTVGDEKTLENQKALVIETSIKLVVFIR